MTTLSPLIRLRDFQMGRLQARVRKLGHASVGFTVPMQDVFGFVPDGRPNQTVVLTWGIRDTSYYTYAGVAILQSVSHVNPQLLRTLPASQLQSFAYWAFVLITPASISLAALPISPMTLALGDPIAPKRVPVAGPGTLGDAWQLIRNSALMSAWRCTRVDTVYLSQPTVDYRVGYSLDVDGVHQSDLFETPKPWTTPLWPIKAENADLCGEVLEVVDLDRPAAAPVWTSAPAVQIDRTKTDLQNFVGGMKVWGYLDSPQASQVIDQWNH